MKKMRSNSLSVILKTDLRQNSKNLSTVWSLTSFAILAVFLSGAFKKPQTTLSECGGSLTTNVIAELTIAGSDGSSESIMKMDDLPFFNIQYFQNSLGEQLDVHIPGNPGGTPGIINDFYSLRFGTILDWLLEFSGANKMKLFELIDNYRPVASTGEPSPFARRLSGKEIQIFYQHSNFKIAIRSGKVISVGHEEDGSTSYPALVLEYPDGDKAAFSLAHIVGLQIF